MNIISIDGSSGGGQLLRSSLSLSLITGQAFHMTNIRGARKPKPGLMRQHLTCVQAAAQIGQAQTEGATLGSQELRFLPGKISAGDYHFAIGTGGSTTLVLQTLLPALLYADGKSTVRIEGGTHNPMAPPMDFIMRCYLPMLHRMGVKATTQLERHGYMLAGGGSIFSEIHPIKKWKKLNATERGELKQSSGTLLYAHLSCDVADRARHSAAKVFDWDDERIQLQNTPDTAGPGGILMLSADFEHITEISSAVAQLGRTSESVGASAAKGLRNFLNASCGVGLHLADQLLLHMALAGGGRMTTLTLSKHLLTNMALIPKFLPVSFRSEDLGGGSILVEAVASKST